MKRSYIVMCRRHTHKGYFDDDDYICEFDGIRYQSEEDAKFSLMYAKDFGEEAWISEEIYEEDHDDD